MQRKVVEILKKYLNVGYDDYQTEIMYESAFGVLMAGGVKEIPTDDWHRAERHPRQCEDMLVRPLARELITTIRGVKDIDLYIIPDKERVVRILRDIYPSGLTVDKSGHYDAKDEIFWAEYHADYIIKELRRIRPQEFWRGKRISNTEEKSPE